MKKKGLFQRLAVSAAGLLLGLGTAMAGTVGDIAVFYNSTGSPCPGGLTALCTININVNNTTEGGSPLDAPVFVFQNTSSTPITGAVLTIEGIDSYDVGTIAGNSSVTVIPGISNDGQNHGSNNFFTVTGTPYDSSDLMPALNSTEFEFTGMQGGTQIESMDVCGIITAPVFTPQCTAAVSNDGSVHDPTINFLGGPGDNDGPCNNCLGPVIAANLITVTSQTPPPSTTPEPSSLALIGTGLMGLGFHAWRRRRALTGIR